MPFIYLVEYKSDKSLRIAKQQQKHILLLKLNLPQFVCDLHYYLVTLKKKTNLAPCLFF